jgi:hypothetical protein
LLKGSPVKVRAKPFAKVKPLIAAGEGDIDKAFAALSTKLRASGEAAEVQFDVAEARKSQRWCLSLEPKSSSLSAGASRRPDLHLIARREIWQRIAEGELSPVEAYVGGQFRVRGDVELAKRILKRVGGRGEVDPCN